MMIDIESFVREVHGYLTEQCSARPSDEKASQLRKSAWSILTDNRPLVFAWCAPGYLAIGEENAPRLFSDPCLSGLGDAWEIFVHGPAVGSILTAAELAGAPSGKALRNRLEHAAIWVESVARCPGLAKALRSPSIVVGRDGRIEYNRASHRPLILHC